MDRSARTAGVRRRGHFTGTSFSVLGAEIEARPDGSMYRMSNYPQAGYRVAYSRTPGDALMVMITRQKSP